MGILPSCSHVSITVWLHQKDYDKTIVEKATYKLYKDVVYCFEQVLEAAPYKAAVVTPLTSHFSNYQSKTSKTCWVLVGK